MILYNTYTKFYKLGAKPTRVLSMHNKTVYQYLNS